VQFHPTDFVEATYPELFAETFSEDSERFQRSISGDDIRWKLH